MIGLIVAVSFFIISIGIVFGFAGRTKKTDPSLPIQDYSDFDYTKLGARN